MAGRLCGYCRLEGHQIRKCETYAEHRNLSLAHTPKERKFFLDSLAKLGFGLGATFRLKQWYGSLDDVCTITGHDWVNQLQFCTFKRIRYSKQVKITPTESFTRIGEKMLSADNQYGNTRIKALVVNGGGISEQWVDVRYSSLVRAKDIDPTTNLLSNGTIALVSASFQPYEYTADDLCSKVAVHKRISSLEPERWDDVCFETGISPL